MLKGSSSTCSSSHRCRGGGGEAITPSRPERASQALPLQALHLAYEAGLFATYGVPAWASGRPSRVVVSSAAGLIITVTDYGDVP